MHASAVGMASEKAGGREFFLVSDSQARKTDMGGLRSDQNGTTENRTKSHAPTTTDETKIAQARAENTVHIENARRAPNRDRGHLTKAVGEITDADAHTIGKRRIDTLTTADACALAHAIVMTEQNADRDQNHHAIAKRVPVPSAIENIPTLTPTPTPSTPSSALHHPLLHFPAAAAPTARTATAQQSTSASTTRTTTHAPTSSNPTQKAKDQA